ncbi:MAG: hypothetical protein JWM33_2849 [Caulobacteraceae bacterium]|nr:hypothetical protein [Caulobacteraceae bacterium]
MKTLIAAAAAFGLFAIAAPAFADTQLGLGYTNLDSNNTDLGSVDASISWDSASMFGLEAQGGVGVKSDGSGAAKVKEQWNLAAYGTVRAPISDMLSVRGRLGYGGVNVKTPAGGSNTENGIAGGAGVQLMFNPSNGVRVDYTYQDLDHGHSNNWGAQFVHKF